MKMNHQPDEQITPPEPPSPGRGPLPESADSKPAAVATPPQTAHSASPQTAHSTSPQTAHSTAYRTDPSPVLPGQGVVSSTAAPSPRGPRRPRTWRCSKERYHHGSLREAAIARGLAVVARAGPMGVTMAGIARDCGVSPAGLVYYFHNRAGLRAAIANAAAEQMRPFSVFRAGGARSASALRDNSAAWVEYAAKNPNLYRIVFGEGWRGNEPATLPRSECLHSIDRVANIGQMSRHIRAGATRDHAWYLWSAMHGLAMSCADGATTPAKVKPLIERFVAGLSAV